MSTTTKDSILNPPQSGNDDKEPRARAERKRLGLTVDSAPYDYTTGDVEPVIGLSPADSVSVTIPISEENDETPLPRLSYADMYKKLSVNKQPTKEEEEKQRKKEQRDKTLATIGDAFNAMHQAYAHARGVQPMAGSEVNLQGKVRERYDKLMKEREARRQEYLNGYLKAMQMDQAEIANAWTKKYQKRSLALREREEERRQATAALEVRKQGWLEQLNQQKLDIQKEKNEIEKAYRNQQMSKMRHDMYMQELDRMEKLMKAGGRTKKYTYDSRGRLVELSDTPNINPDVENVISGLRDDNGDNNGGNKKQNPMGGKKKNPMN